MFIQYIIVNYGVFLMTIYKNHCGAKSNWLLLKIIQLVKIHYILSRYIIYLFKTLINLNSEV